MAPLYISFCNSSKSCPVASVMGQFKGKSATMSLISRKKLWIQVGNIQSPIIRRDLRSSNSFLGFCSKSQYLFQCNKQMYQRIRFQVNSVREVNQTPVDRENHRLRKRFSLRLRPRLRLLSIQLRKVSIRLILEEIRAFLRKNSRTMVLSSSIFVVLGLLYLFLKLISMPYPKTVPYSDLITSLQAGYVCKVLFEEGSRRIYFNTAPHYSGNFPLLDNKPFEGENAIGKPEFEAAGSVDIRTQSVMGKNLFRRSLRNPVKTPEWQFATRKIDHDENFLLGLMREKGTTYSSAPQSVFMSMRSVLITVVSLWIPLTPLMWLLYRQFSTANSPAKKRRPQSQNVSFDDVEGVDTAKYELMEIVSCLQGAINYNKLGAKLPRGVLLVGPPGTGKTLLARAVAGEAGVPFFTVSASEFVELFVGRGAARIRDLFNNARKCAPSIIFIDELDAVGGKRGRSFNDERDQTLNQLLTEMDGFESEMKVVVIAATNRSEALDPALCRPGRFSRKVFVGEPDADGRRKILAVHLRGVPLEEDTDVICNLVASLTQGFVGADLANIINEAALLAARRDIYKLAGRVLGRLQIVGTAKDSLNPRVLYDTGGETVTREDIMEAIERAKFGINNRQFSHSSISKELGKLFPWMPSLLRKNDTKENGSHQPLGYQALS